MMIYEVSLFVRGSRVCMPVCILSRLYYYVSVLCLFYKAAHETIKLNKLVYIYIYIYVYIYILE